MSTPHAELIPDELILAALDRAMRHRERQEAATKNSIYQHLAIPTRSGAARHVHRRIAALEETGAVERSRRHGFDVWSLTSYGWRRLQPAQHAGKIELPESPQHQEWRNARNLAGQEIERFREEIRDCITDAMEQVDSEARSDVLYEIAERLNFQCRRLASATYCLEEWVEPDDAHADIDTRLEPGEENLPRSEQVRLRSRRAGRRSTLNWSTR